VGSDDTLTGLRAHATGRHRGSKCVWANACGLNLTPHRPHVVSSRHTLLDAKQNGIMRCAHEMPTAQSASACAMRCAADKPIMIREFRTLQCGGQLPSPAPASQAQAGLWNCGF